MVVRILCCYFSIGFFLSDELDAVEHDTLPTQLAKVVAALEMGNNSSSRVLGFVTCIY